jgi:hypothetical protein
MKFKLIFLNAFKFLMNGPFEQQLKIFLSSTSDRVNWIDVLY